MTKMLPIRKTRLATLLGCALACASAMGQVSGYGDKQMGENNGAQLPTVLQRVGVEQHLNAPLPLDAPFTDETGKAVKLGDYFNGKQAGLFALVYYRCPMLCSEEMDGMASALQMVKLKPGKDFQIVMVSIDPRETPQDAAEKKAMYVKRYGHPETADGWHFLVGPKTSIDAASKASGYGYVEVKSADGKTSQFAHASALEVVTPEGRLAQYYMGVEYSPKDLLLGLIEASGNKIGSPVANILTYCYHYDPQQNKHSLIVARVVQLGGMITVAGLGGFMFLMFRRDMKLGRDHSLTKRQNG